MFILFGKALKLAFVALLLRTLTGVRTIQCPPYLP